MKTLLIILGVVVIAAAAFLAVRRHWGRPQVSKREYVSLTCEKGDIMLTLLQDHRFVLLLKYWDAKTSTHLGEERLEGKWTEDGNTLVLTTSGSRLMYSPRKIPLTIGPNSLTVDGYAWVSSTEPTSFDSYELVEREKTDQALLKAANR